MQIYTDFEAQQYINDLRKKNKDFNFAQTFKRALKLEVQTDTELDNITNQKIMLFKQIHDLEKELQEKKKSLQILEDLEAEKKKELEAAKSQEEKELREILTDWYGLTDEDTLKTIVQEFFSSSDNIKRRRFFVEEQAKKYQLSYIQVHKRKNKEAQE